MDMHLKKFDDELQIVYGEVYAPNVPDSQGDYMTVEEVRKMAHSFMVKGDLRAVDKNHDNDLTGSVIVESFISRSKDEDFIPDSWVVGVHVPDVALWAEIKKGEINGFSMEALMKTKESEIELEIDDVIVGKTLSDNSDHSHTYRVRFDDDGLFLGGQTDIVNGHYHSITKGTVTDSSSDHTHRFSMMEEFELVES